MHPHEQLIHDFYTAFQKLDHEGMAACYHPEVQFSDPAFPDLKGWKASAMWHMLCTRAKDFALTYSDVKADDTTGEARWEAKYVFSATGNRVHNKIHARFKFKEGKIVDHRDDFNFHAWAGQALGLPGKLLGWAPFMKSKVQTTANGNLEKFIAKEGLAP